jgi:osmotically inducible protein OsmC
MAVRTSQATWQGNLPQGRGTMRVGAGHYEGPYTFASRFESGEGTNPEELIAAAHAGCYSMALANMLSKAGHEPQKVHTKANVHLEKGETGFSITRVVLDTEVTAPGLDEATFREQTEAAKKGCPVSRALGAIEIQLNAKLVG